MRTKHQLFSLLIGALLITSIANTAMACFCTFTLEENFKNAKAVVLANISNLRHHTEPQIRDFIPAQEYIEADVRVLEQFKGKPSDAINVQNSTGGCGIPLVTGEKYIFFIRNDFDGRQNHVDWCTGSRIVEYNDFKLDNLLLKLRRMGGN